MNLPHRHFNRAASAAITLVAAFSMVACRHKDEAPVTPQQSGPVISGADNAPEHGFCLYGCPTGAPSSNHVVARSLYVLSNNADTKFSDWVGYRVANDTIGETKVRNWHQDPDLPENETLKKSDYKGARQGGLDYDIGHQAPLASLSGHPDWAETDYLSNTTPQKKYLNEGPWLQLENAERRLAEKYGMTTYTLTGPLYEREMPKLPNARLDHKVPSGYWKIIAVKDGDSILTAAFVMDQDMKRRDDYCATSVTPRNIETRTHLNFFPRMAQEKQDKIETSRGALLPQLGCK